MNPQSLAQIISAMSSFAPKTTRMLAAPSGGSGRSATQPQRQPQDDNEMLAKTLEILYGNQGNQPPASYPGTPGINPNAPHPARPQAQQVPASQQPMATPQGQQVQPNQDPYMRTLQQQYKDAQLAHLKLTNGPFREGSIAGMLYDTATTEKEFQARQNIYDIERQMAEHAVKQQSAYQNQVAKDTASMLAESGVPTQQAVRMGVAHARSGADFDLKDFDYAGPGREKILEQRQRLEWMRNDPLGQDFVRRVGQEAADEYFAEGTIPEGPGWQYTRNPDGTVTPLPGSPAWRDQAELFLNQRKHGLTVEKWQKELSDEYQKSVKAKQNTQAHSSKALVQLEDAIDMFDNNWDWTIAGIGSTWKHIPATDAKNLKEKLTTIASMVSFDRLQEMRESSPTGGALGNVSNFEVEMLASNTAPLAQGQSPKLLRQSLEDVRRSYLRLQFINENEAQLTQMIAQHPDGKEAGEAQVRRLLDKQFGAHDQSRIDGREAAMREREAAWRADNPEDAAAWDAARGTVRPDAAASDGFDAWLRAQGIDPNG